MQSYRYLSVLLLFSSGLAYSDTTPDAKTTTQRVVKKNVPRGTSIENEAKPITAEPIVLEKKETIEFKSETEATKVSAEEVTIDFKSPAIVDAQAVTTQEPSPSEKEATLKDAQDSLKAANEDKDDEDEADEESDDADSEEADTAEAVESTSPLSYKAQADKVNSDAQKEAAENDEDGSDDENDASDDDDGDDEDDDNDSQEPDDKEEESADEVTSATDDDFVESEAEKSELAALETEFKVELSKVLDQGVKDLLEKYPKIAELLNEGSYSIEYTFSPSTDSEQSKEHEGSPFFTSDQKKAEFMSILEEREIL